MNTKPRETKIFTQNQFTQNQVLSKKSALLSAFIGLYLATNALLYGMSVNAQGAVPKLGVSPTMFELGVERGQVVKDKIKIKNFSEVPLPISVTVVDFTAGEETGEIVFDESSQDISFASRFWFKFENPNFILDSGEMEELKFSISVPENAEPGGRYAVLLFEPQLPSYYFEEEKPRVIPYVGVLFLLSVNVEGLTRPEKPLVIAEFNIPEKFHLKKLENFTAGLFGIFSEALAERERLFSIVESGQLPFTLRIKNNDIYHIKPSGKLVIYSGNQDENASRPTQDEKRSRPVGETEIRKTTILPGKTREIPVEFKPNLEAQLEKYLPRRISKIFLRGLPAAVSDFISRNLMWGKYTAVLELDVLAGEAIEFWVFPWKTAISTVLIFAIIAFLITKYRRRIKLAIETLIHADKS